MRPHAVSVWPGGVGAGVVAGSVGRNVSSGVALGVAAGVAEADGDPWLGGAVPSYAPQPARTVAIARTAISPDATARRRGRGDRGSGEICIGESYPGMWQDPVAPRCDGVLVVVRSPAHQMSADDARLCADRRAAPRASHPDALQNRGSGSSCLHREDRREEDEDQEARECDAPDDPRHDDGSAAQGSEVCSHGPSDAGIARSCCVFWVES